MVNIGSSDGSFLFDTKPLPEPMHWEQTGTIGYTRYRAICKHRLLYTNQWCIIWNNFYIQHFQWIKSISKWCLLNGSHIFQASIWLFENVPGSLDTLGTEPSVNNVYKTMFLFKISENIYILPIWASTVINQIVNKVLNALKQPHHMNPIFYIWRKSVTFKPRQDKTRHDKAWQGKARRGQTRQDEAAPRQEGVPWFWKITPVI